MSGLFSRTRKSTTFSRKSLSKSFWELYNMYKGALLKGPLILLCLQEKRQQNQHQGAAHKQRLALGFELAKRNF